MTSHPSRGVWLSFRLANRGCTVRIIDMLLPRFSLRLLLLLITVSGVFFFVVAQAVGRHAWAIALTAGISAILGTILLHAMVFSLAWTMTFLWRRMVGHQTSGSPFATTEPPPQIIPPMDLE